MDRTQALLEQVRRLERGLTGAAPEEHRGSGDALSGGQWADALNVSGGLGAVDAERGNVNKIIGLGYGQGSALEDLSEETGAAPSGEEETSGIPLSVQLERLDRAALSGGQAAQTMRGGGGRSAYPNAAPVSPGAAAHPGLSGTAEADRGSGARPGRSGFPPAEALRWAEQADREFRRDSRRYDGGFSLY